MCLIYNLGQSSDAAKVTFEALAPLSFSLVSFVFHDHFPTFQATRSGRSSMEVLLAFLPQPLFENRKHDYFNTTKNRFVSIWKPAKRSVPRLTVPVWLGWISPWRRIIPGMNGLNTKMIPSRSYLGIQSHKLKLTLNVILNLILTHTQTSCCNSERSVAGLDWPLCHRATEQWLTILFYGTIARWPVQARSVVMRDQCPKGH